MSITALNELVKRTETQISTHSDKKFVDANVIVSILVYQGLKILLPEIKEWIKLGFSTITLKRLEIEKRLKDYALEKELDYKTASEASGKIAENINENNIKDIVTELEDTK